MLTPDKGKISIHSSKFTPSSRPSARIILGILLGTITLTLIVFYTYSVRTQSLLEIDLRKLEHLQLLETLLTDRSPPGEEVPHSRPSRVEENILRTGNNLVQELITSPTIKGMLAMERIKPEDLREFEKLWTQQTALERNRLSLSKLSDSLTTFAQKQNQSFRVLTASIWVSVLSFGLFFVVVIWNMVLKSQFHRQVLEFHRQTMLSWEQEKKALSRELHDTIAQDLAATKIILSQTPLPDGKLTVLNQILDGAIADVRHLAAGLRPPLLDDFGLQSSLEDLAQSFSRRSGLSVVYHFDPLPSWFLTQIRLSPQETGINIYRILQEGLMNSWKHGRFKIVEMSIHCEDQKVRFILQEKGPREGDRSADSPHSSLGLLGMQERAQLLGGHLKYIIDPWTGTRIEMEVPRDHHYRR